MELTDTQVRRANNIFNYLRKMSKEFHQHNEIVICDSCNGTGTGATSYDGCYSWDCRTYCDKCYGVGYLGFSKKRKMIDAEHFICSKCEGVGCENCKHIGIVDWVANIMGR